MMPEEKCKSRFRFIKKNKLSTYTNRYMYIVYDNVNELENNLLEIRKLSDIDNVDT